jgi:hypothetical protein
MVTRLVAEGADASPLIRPRQAGSAVLAALGLSLPAAFHLSHHPFVDGTGFCRGDRALIPGDYRLA